MTNQAFSKAGNAQSMEVLNETMQTSKKSTIRDEEGFEEFSGDEIDAQVTDPLAMTKNLHLKPS